ncbi:MAG: 3-deoxy-7-phosphoheptulonate synthase [Planctomycetota bacterium]|jgi:3-deoxy-7-phosphoheptulonate synthase
MEQTDNLNILRFKPLITPDELRSQLPETDEVAGLVASSRVSVHKILTNKDPRRLVIAGPCSLHDREATLEYAGKLKDLQDQVGEKILIIMRAYFEKPRTTLGWKGMLYDPCLDNSFKIEEGFHRARSLLLSIAELGLPTATEFLDPIVPQYTADLITWAAIGARTTESQIHRQMASGLSMPVGFKNSMDGNLSAAIDAIKAAASPHFFMGIDGDGKVVVAETRGNSCGHLVMRGGAQGPNYASEHVAFAEVLLCKANVPTGIIVDCSHANSNKDHKRQRQVLFDVTEQIGRGNRLIAGVMLESFLREGNQPVDTPDNLEYGVSLTDKCIGWEETEELIRHLADAL